MTPRTVRTFKLLVVAAATAGCTRAVVPEIAESPSPAPAEAPPYPPPPAAVHVQTPIALPQPVQAPAPSDPPANDMRPIPPLPSGPVGDALLALSNELRAAGPEKARQQRVYFRPLCDDDGYPMVGNVMTKAMTRTYGAGAFCAEVRKQAKR